MGAHHQANSPTTKNATAAGRRKTVICRDRLMKMMSRGSLRALLQNRAQLVVVSAAGASKKRDGAPRALSSASEVTVGRWMPHRASRDQSRGARGFRPIRWPFNYF